MPGNAIGGFEQSGQAEEGHAIPGPEPGSAEHGVEEPGQSHPANESEWSAYHLLFAQCLPAEKDIASEE